MTETTYKLVRGADGQAIIECHSGSQRVRTLSPYHSLKLRNHSPTGFEWGYGGSGPAQAALAILFDAFLNSSLALKWYQEFKRDVVADVPYAGGSISLERIVGWVAGEEKAEKQKLQ